MPLFEYQCVDCSHKFEVLIRGREQAACPRCGSQQVEKCLSVFAVSTRSPAPAQASGACASCPHAGPSGCGMEH
jgi:putative FmdB family regulatory protein